MTDNALTKNRSRTPKMRTIPQAYKELKAADPNSAISCAKWYQTAISHPYSFNRKT